MESSQSNDDHAAQRVQADAAKGRNHRVANAAKGIRQSGRHTEVIRQGNPGRTNRAKVN